MACSWHRRFIITAALTLGACLLTTAPAAGRPGVSRVAQGRGAFTSAACTGGWRMLPSPSTGTAYFSALAVVSPREVWAVGSAGVGTEGRPLAARWDGARWHIMAPPALPPSPPVAFNAYGQGAVFNAVAALSAQDVWAVGSRPTASGTRSFIAHWTGARWRVIAGPEPGPDSDLRAIAAVSARDIWAVGTVGERRTLAEHWDGRAWRIVPTPRVSGHDVLFAGIAALSPQDVWVAGTRGSASDSTRQGLIERWDGRRWRIVPSPQPGVVDDALSGTGADTVGDVWAVGSAEGNDYQTVPLVERWSGSAWRVAPAPVLPAADENGLSAVAVLSPRDVWAAADSALSHWAGARWQTTTLRTSSYTSGPNYTTASIPSLAAVTVGRDGSVWAAGRVVVQTDLQYIPLLVRYVDRRGAGRT